MLVLFFALGLITKLCETSGANSVAVLLDSQVENTCDALVGLDSAYTASLLMLCGGFAVVLVPLALFVWQLMAARSFPILRIASTMEPPQVLLTKGLRYNLFLYAAPPKPLMFP